MSSSSKASDDGDGDDGDGRSDDDDEEEEATSDDRGDDGSIGMTQRPYGGSECRRICSEGV